MTRELRVRHALPAENVALLRLLGWRVIVDARAPRCVRVYGRRLDKVRDGCRECDRLDALNGR